jgi:hypothetical protein
VDAAAHLEHLDPCLAITAAAYLWARYLYNRREAINAVSSSVVGRSQSRLTQAHAGETSALLSTNPGG